MTEHLVLIFAYSFPPKNEIGGARPSRFSKYLSRLGYTCRVFTAADQVGRNDPNTKYVPDPFVTHPQRSLSWHIERAARKLFLPADEGTRWSYEASRAARACIRAHPGARVTILSSFPPFGSHLAGWLLARTNGSPWIADFRDPLALTIKGHYRIPLPRLWLQHVVMQRAEAVITNTDSALVRWQEKFPSSRNKFHLIWNGFDPEERINPLPVLSRDYKILSHVGELYSGRTAAPILESIGRLIRMNRLPARRVRVRLIGPVQSDCLPSPEFIDRAKAQGWLELVNNKIPHQQAIGVEQTSDALLLLQPHSMDQVPGKLFEYLQIGRPILASVQPNSSCERLIERSGVPHRCVYPGSTPEAIDDIVAGFFDLPSTAVTPSPWFEEQFNAEHQTRVLDSIIRSLQSEEPNRKFTAGFRR
jgi:hypothetical protein